MKGFNLKLSLAILFLKILKKFDILNWGKSKGGLPVLSMANNHFHALN